MSRQQFEEYIAARAEAPAESAIDWDARRDEWLRRLDEFYGRVEGYLQPYVERGAVCMDFAQRPMREEHVGAYDARALEIRIGPDTICLDPIGTELIGAWGRVDMVGPKGSARFVLVPETLSEPKVEAWILQDGETPPPERELEIDETTWKIATPPPRVLYEEFNDDSFFSAMMEVLDA